MGAPKPVSLVTGTAGAYAPEPLAVIGGLPAASTSAFGGVKKAAVVAPATVATDGTSAGTQLNLLILSLRAAGVIA